MGRSSIYIRCSSDRLLMQDSREIDYFGQRILPIIQPIATGEDRREVLALLAQSVANNFGADGCWVLQYLSPGMRVAASACVSHRTEAISTKLPNFPIPAAATPTKWRMPLLPDYQFIVVETHSQGQANGCLVLATKGVEWYSEMELILQLVSDYVGVALIEADLQVQAHISQVYPKLHHHLTQAIVENQPIDRLFEIAVSDMVEALKLKRGLVLTIKASDLSKQPPQSSQLTNAGDRSAESIVDISTPDRPTSSPHNQPPTTIFESSSRPKSPIDPKPGTHVQIVTTIDVRKGDAQALPASFLLEDSYLCQAARANVPNPTIFDSSNRTTSTDRLIFQDDRLPSIAMIPLVGTITPDRQPSDALWGWLVLQHDCSRHWHPVELNLLQCQIYQIALARIHKQALKQVRNHVASRTAQVQTSIELQIKLHEAGRKQMDKLRQANEFKDEFINTIGHELRTPLTSMSLAIVMLRQADVDPDRRKQYLDILDDQCQREIKLVSDLLKFQQLESHQLELRPQQITLNQFISEQATFVADRWLDSKSLELSLHLPSVSPQIQTDADSLKHIVEELLINAGKFAIPQTIIEVWLTVEPERAVFQVANLSKPISSEDLPILFERFRRGTGTTQQAIAGTGLGLALVKSMVEHIQGNIIVTSNPVGETTAKTCFTVTIPTVLERN